MCRHCKNAMAATSTFCSRCGSHSAKNSRDQASGVGQVPESGIALPAHADPQEAGTSAAVKEEEDLASRSVFPILERHLGHSIEARNPLLAQP